MGTCSLSPVFGVVIWIPDCSRRRYGIPHHPTPTIQYPLPTTHYPLPTHPPTRHPQLTPSPPLVAALCLTPLLRLHIGHVRDGVNKQSHQEN